MSTSSHLGSLPGIPGHVTRRIRSRRLFLEQLESRMPLAGHVVELPPEGYQAAIVLEIVDLAGNVVTSVKVGDDFRLRARLLVPAGEDPFSGSGDFTFLPELVSPVVDPTDLGVKHAKIRNGEIDEAGRIIYQSAAPDLIISKTFRAMAAGTATFGSNAPENLGLEILFTGLEAILDNAEISFGSVSLEIVASDAPPPAAPETPPEGTRKVDYDLARIADEYAAYLLSGSTGTFRPSVPDAMIRNNHVLIMGRNNEMGYPPRTEEEFAALADEMRSKAGVINIANKWGLVCGWLPLERIRDLAFVPSLTYAYHFRADYADGSLPPAPDTSPTPPVEQPPIEQPPVMEDPPVQQPAADYAVTVFVDVLNMAGEVVTSVRVGEEFVLRARLVVNELAVPFAAHMNLTISTELLDLINSSSDLGLANSEFSGNEFKGIGRAMYSTDYPDIIFKKTFRATAEGTATFSTSASEHAWHEILYIGLSAPLKASQVDFRNVSLKIVAADAELPPTEPPVAEPVDETASSGFIVYPAMSPSEGTISYDILWQISEPPPTPELMQATPPKFDLLPILSDTPFSTSQLSVTSVTKPSASQPVANDSHSNWQLIANSKSATTSTDEVVASDSADKDSDSESSLQLESHEFNATLKSERE